MRVKILYDLKLLSLCGFSRRKKKFTYDVETTVHLLKDYNKENKFSSLEALVNQGFQDKILSEDVHEFTFDTEEKRFFGKSVKLQGKVFKQPFIKFRNSNTVHITNSVIFGDLVLSSDEGPLEVYLDNCIIAGEMRFFGCTSKKAEIADCNIQAIKYYNSQVDYTYISTSRLSQLGSNLYR